MIYRQAVLLKLILLLKFMEKIASSCSNVDFTNCAILAPKNKHCNEINDKVVEVLSGVSKTYFSVNRLIVEEEGEALNFPLEFLDSLNLSGLPPHKLTLLEGVFVMLLRNLNVSKGLSNGTRLIVWKRYENCLDLQVISGEKAGERISLPRIDLSPADSSLPFSFKRRQFPIRIAFCMTIIKAKGQTLKRVGIYLPQTVFGHGQLYVALSRATSYKNFEVQILPKGNRTKNIVHKEVLRSFINPKSLIVIRKLSKNKNKK